MSTATPATASALIAGLLLGTVSARPKLRRIRAELADIRRLAEQDALTGLPNRAGAQRHLRLAAATGRAQAAVLLDLDKFKTVNDTWGHQTGDALLVAVAARLAHACTPIAASVARLSGDEFLLLLPHADPHTLLTQVRTVLDGLHEPMTLSVDGAATTTVTPTASAGIALPESPPSTVCAWTPSRHSATRPMLPGSRPVPASRARAPERWRSPAPRGLICLLSSSIPPAVRRDCVVMHTRCVRLTEGQRAVRTQPPRSGLVAQEDRSRARYLDRSNHRIGSSAPVDRILRPLTQPVNRRALTCRALRKWTTSRHTERSI